MPLFFVQKSNGFRYLSKINAAPIAPNPHIDGGVKIVNSIIVFLEIMHYNLSFVRIDHPVLPYPGFHVFVELNDSIAPFGGGGEDFDDQIRCTVDTSVDDLVSVAYDTDIRLYHGLVVAV